MIENDSIRFSLVIPTQNEQNYIPALLDTVDVTRLNYRSGSNSIEIIVADNDIFIWV